MSNEASPDLAELIRRALESRIADVHVSMPGEIVSYDPATQTATVRPCLRQVVLDSEDEQVATEYPPIQNVPVSWPGCAGLTLHGVLAAGDTGDLIFSTFSHNEWQAGGKVSTPGDLKPHNLGAAKFYPGLRHAKNVAPDTDNSIGTPGGVRARFGSALEVSSSPVAPTQGVVLDTLLTTVFTALKGFITAAAATETSAAGLGGMAALAGLIGSWPATPLASAKLRVEP